MEKVTGKLQDSSDEHDKKIKKKAPSPPKDYWKWY